MTDDSTRDTADTADTADSADAADASPTRQRQRRLAAWNAAERSLAANLVQPMAAQLARLAEQAPAAHDLTAWTDTYGDGAVAALEERTADLLGKPAALWFPTGTMAQQVALRCWAGRTGNPTVALHPMSHPERWERQALTRVSGLRTLHAGAGPQPVDAADVRGLDEPFGALMLELPLRDAGFVLPTWEELTAVVEAARERDAVVHFDGARLWESTRHLGRSLPEIADLADSVYVSFYKSLGGLSGAALAGPRDFVDEAGAWRHRYGGDVFQQWPAALAALAGLDRELPRLPEYVAHAQVVAGALEEAFTEAGVPWFRVHPEQPHTHQFQVWLPFGARDLDEASVRQPEETGTLLFRRWEESGPPGTAMTECTVDAAGLRWSARDVRDAVHDFLSRLPGGGRPPHPGRTPHTEQAAPAD
ncbi:beta-eliminating lyase-related protein [Streptomyces sp. 549]|uniref:threonine aldolase family protein n=1 Tax=Streptomyces sp. 549 TaxID=3049076 RepID=UPI0024C2E8C9|nr:beta-eliminating lyase-related protein [Streptomyces sp. 549]MDK1472329.1 beta-eliminating lyase-related protein [Streptomyces sp. 549]